MDIFERAKIIMFPIDIKSIQPKDCIGLLFKNENNILSILDNIEDIVKANAYFNAIPQYLYFLSLDKDEKICEGDWVYHLLDNEPIFYDGDYELSNNPIEYGYRKIIASSDPKLNLPKPSRVFIKKYCEKGGIDEVNIEYEEALTPALYEGRTWADKKALDPNGSRSFYMKSEVKIKVNENNEITIKSAKDAFTEKDLKNAYIAGLKSYMNFDDWFNSNF